MVMIRREAYKYIHTDIDRDVLYDLQNDPHELHNLCDEPAQQERISAFADEVKSRWDLATLDRDIRQSQKQRKLVGAALAQGHREAWDYQPQPDYSRLYVREPGGAELSDRKVRVAAKGYPLPGDAS